MVEEKASREILQSFVEDDAKSDVAMDLMRVEDIFNMLSPRVSDLCATLDVPPAWPQLVRDIRRMMAARNGGGGAKGGGGEGNYEASRSARRCRSVIDSFVGEVLDAAFMRILDSTSVTRGREGAPLV